ncbi:hypothetical protein SIID45300_01043 [Candidatus Magnetaquicoccaceae bacterium FCR-1]|uniref:HTH cro/C1-type domain-containing protein n=1 Tax=Candidatus Magnetaquiglobus chichijimensis TaxID=3141448 RepID=A0ABQ0C764_9PROT
MVEIFERLRSERKRLGFNQTDFAEKAGVGLGSQVRYESGERLPDAGYLAAIDTIGADVQYILSGVRSNTIVRMPNRELLAWSIAVVEEALIATKRTTTPEKKANIILAVYTAYQDDAEKPRDKDLIMHLIRAA